MVQFIEEHHGVGRYSHIIEGKMDHKLKCIDHAPEELESKSHSVLRNNILNAR